MRHQCSFNWKTEYDFYNKITVNDSNKIHMIISYEAKYSEHPYTV